MVEHRTDLLSRQEWQIIRLASDGLADKEIGVSLKISPATVKTYWERIRQKLVATNKTHAVCLALLNHSTRSHRCNASINDLRTGLRRIVEQSAETITNSRQLMAGCHRVAGMTKSIAALAWSGDSASLSELAIPEG